MQIMRGRVEDERMTEKTIGKIQKFYDAIKEAFARFDKRGVARVPAFRPPTAPQFSSLVRKGPVTQSSVEAIPFVLPPSTLSAADRQNFTFPSPPAFPKPQSQLLTSRRWPLRSC